MYSQVSTSMQFLVLPLALSITSTISLGAQNSKDITYQHISLINSSMYTAVGLTLIITSSSKVHLPRSTIQCQVTSKYLLSNQVASPIHVTYLVGRTPSTTSNHIMSSQSKTQVHTQVFKVSSKEVYTSNQYQGNIIKE